MSFDIFMADSDSITVAISLPAGKLRLRAHFFNQGDEG